MGILVNKPVQWKVTSFLVGSSDVSTALFFLSSQALYWPGNISNDASFGHQHQEYAGRSFWKNGKDMWDLKIWKKTFARWFCLKDFDFYPILGEHSIDFQIWLIFSNALKVETNESADLQMVGVAMVLRDETNAWNCLFVVRLLMLRWTSASKRPGGGNYNIVDIPFRYMLCYIMLHARYQHSEIMRKNQPQKIPRCKTPFFFHFSLTMHGMHICRWCWFTTGLERQRRTRGHRSRDVEWGNWLEFNKNGMLWHAYFIFFICTGFF